MFVLTKYHKIYEFITAVILRKTIHGGLLLALPLVIIGAISLTITSIPIPAYQTFIHSLLDGKAYSIFNLIFTYAFSTLPLIFLFTMSFSFGKAVCNDINEILYYPVITFCAFLIFMDSPSLKFSDIFGNTQTFTSIVITISTCSSLYILRSCKFTNMQLYLKNPTSVFISVYKMLIPSLAVLLFFSIVNTFFSANLKDSFIHIHRTLFESLGMNMGSAILYAFIEHLYWFFGIHGSNVLDGVTYSMMEPLTKANMEAVANGFAAKETYTHTFLYAFVWMGGSGAVLSLLLSIFFFTKNSHMNRIARFSLLPCLLNIGEIITIGLPIICNPIFLLPFIAVPIFCVISTSLAMQWGIVPVPTHLISWTAPILFSGYIVTGSVAGSFLQLFNLTIGVLIYKPFVQYYEKTEIIKFKQNFDALVNEVIRCERLGKTPYFHGNNELEETSRNLTFDLRQAIKKKELHLYYQPQVNYDGTLYGGEALLRWKHPQLGFIYPPLIIFLAKEEGFLDELGISLIEMAFSDLQRLTDELDDPVKISVNVAPPQLYNQDFCKQVQALLQNYHFNNSTIAFEITEQIALSGAIEIMERLRELRKMGILLSMDDFGMGHSSVLYLQDSEFDIVKLDGSLTKKFLTNERSVDIISSITQLSQKFNYKVVAEYVETAEQREKLSLLGCHIYQGWLYSPAIPFPEFIAYAKKHCAKSCG